VLTMYAGSELGVLFGTAYAKNETILYVPK